MCVLILRREGFLLTDAQGSAGEDVQAERAELRRIRIWTVIIGLIAISPVVYYFLRGGIDYLISPQTDLESNLSLISGYLSVVVGFGSVFAFLEMQGHFMLHMGEGKTITFSRREKLRRMAKWWLIFGVLFTAFLLFGLWYNDLL